MLYLNTNHIHSYPTVMWECPKHFCPDFCPNSPAVLIKSWIWWKRESERETDGDRILESLLVPTDPPVFLIITLFSPPESAEPLCSLFIGGNQQAGRQSSTHALLFIMWSQDDGVPGGGGGLMRKTVNFTSSASYIK